MGLLRRMVQGIGKGRPRLSPSPDFQVPTFEQLEPRVLLSGDMSPMQSLYPLETGEEQVISVDIGEVASGEWLVAHPSLETSYGGRADEVGEITERGLQTTTDGQKDQPGEIEKGRASSEIFGSVKPRRDKKRRQARSEEYKTETSGAVGQSSSATKAQPNGLSISPREAAANLDVGLPSNASGRSLAKTEAFRGRSPSYAGQVAMEGHTEIQSSVTDIAEAVQPTTHNDPSSITLATEGQPATDATIGRIDSRAPPTEIVPADMAAWGNSPAPAGDILMLGYYSAFAGVSGELTGTIRTTDGGTALTNAGHTSPIVITSAAHGLATDQFVVVGGVTGNTAANGLFRITVIDTDAFSMNDSTGNGAYTGGGTWTHVSGPNPKSKTIDEAVTTGRGAWMLSGVSAALGMTPRTTFVDFTGGALTVTDADGGVTSDTLTLSLHGTAIRIHDPHHQIGAGIGVSHVDDYTVDVPLADVSSININALGGDDFLTLDFSGGNPIPTGGLDFSGGTGSGDSLAFTGGTFADALYSFTNENDGVIDLDGSTITYTGLEPITSTITATNVVLNYSNTSETITVTDAGGGRTTVDSTAGETTTFTNPSDSITVNAGSGDDTVDINSLAAGYPAHVTIDGQGDMDTVSFDGNVGLAPDRNLSVRADTIRVGSALSTSGAGFVSLNADRNIDMNSSSRISTVDGDISLEANPTGSVTGSFVGIDVDDAVLTATGAGDVTLNGRGGDTSSDDGVAIDESSMRTFNGAIQITGNAGAGTSSSDGVDIGSDSVIESTGIGSINITGRSGSGSSSDGVEISHSSIRSISGAIGISGDASHADSSCDGVELDDSLIESTSGTIQIAGDSHLAGSSADGVDVNDSSIRSARGHIQITGTASGAGSSADGVELAGGALIQATDTGSIAVTGTGQADGVHITGAGTEVSSIHGAITIVGTGGGVSSAEGVHMTGNLAQVRSVNGDILITGNSGGDDDGVEINNGAQVLSTGTGDDAGTITIHGAGGVGTTDYGVELAKAGTVIRSVDGNIQITGTSPGGDGVNIGDEALVSSTGISLNAARIDIQGTGGGVSSSEGVMVAGSGTTVTSIDGDIHIAGNSGGDDDGVEIHNGALISSTGIGPDSATITINGTGGSGTTDYGIELADAGTTITSVSGNISLTGTSPGGDAVHIGSGAIISSTGPGTNAAEISIAGTGGGVSSSEGVMVAGSGTTVTSIDGDIHIAGNSGGDDDGVEIHNGALISSTGIGPDSATITVTGTGGSGTSDYGIELADTGTAISSVDGKITLTAIDGGGTGDDLMIGSGATVQSTASHVRLQGGDNVTIAGNATVDAAGKVTVEGDFGDADPGVGSTIDIFGTLNTVTQADILGGADDDEINLDPAATAGAIRINGQAGDDSYVMQLGKLGAGVDVDDEAAEGIDGLTINASAAADSLMVNAGQTTLAAPARTVTYTAELEDLTVQSLGEQDVIDVTPSQTATINILGGDPAAVLPGDTLNFNTPAGQVTNLTITGSDGGVFTSTGAYRDVVFDEIESVGPIDANLMINGTELDDTLAVTATGPDSGSMQTSTDGVPGLSIDFTGLSSLTFNAGDGSDAFIINHPAGGLFAPTSGITYNGPGAAGDSDTLTINGGTADTFTYTYTNDGGVDDNQGTVDWDGTTLTYTGLEPISSTISATDVVLNYSAASETITLTDAGGGQTTVDSTAGEIATFTHPTATLTINAGSGDDTVDIASLAASYPAHVTIAGQGGIDTVTFNGNVALAPNRNLSVSADTIEVNSVLSTSAGGHVSLDANRRIDMNAGSGISAVNGNISLEANSAGAVTGSFVGIDLDGAALTATGTGAITISGRGGDTSSDDGIAIDESSIRTSSGAIQLTGNAGAGTSSSDGVDIGSDSVIESTGAGSIDINGRSGLGSSSDGVEIRDSTIRSLSGTLNISGDASHADSSCDGVELDDSLVESASGAIQITGDSHQAGSSADGVDINDSTVRSASAYIQITGTATGAGSSADGVELAGGALIQTTDTGSITLAGVGQADGVYMTGAATEVSSVQGTISICGTGGGISSAEGVHLTGNLAQVRSMYGDILITGDSGGDDDGVEIHNGVLISSTGIGPDAATIRINGAGGSGTTDYGVELAGTGTVITALDGDITITGTSPGGDGVYVGSGAALSSTGTGTQAARVNIEGAGGGMPSDEGVHITGTGTIVTSLDGDIEITGDSGGDDDGVEIDNGAQVSSTGVGSQAANITINGIGDSGSTDYGVEISGTGTGISSIDGHIAMTGTSAVAAGIYIGTGATVEVAGMNGAVTLAANDLALTGTIDAGAGRVTILPSSPGLSFDLGSSSGTGQFVITDAEFDRIVTSDRIRIGDLGTGMITFTDTVDPAGADILELISGALVRDTNTSGHDFVGLQLVLNAILAPGQSPGVFRVDGSVVLKQGHVFQVEIGGPSPGTEDSDHDQVAVTGAVTLGTDVDLGLQSFNGFVPGLGDTFVMIDNQGSAASAGEFDGLPEGTIFSDFLGSGLIAVLSYQGGDGNDVVITVPEISLTVTPATALEDSGQTLDFVFSRSGDTAVPVAVFFSVAGSADLGLDYAAYGAVSFSGTDGRVSFLPGRGTATVVVEAVTDTMVEADESVEVTLAPGSDYNIDARVYAQGTILNDDSAELVIADVSALEGDTLVFTVTISHAVQGGINVAFQTADGTAQVSDDDYVSTSGTLSFAGPAGEQQTITVTTTADTKVEAHETLAVSLNNVQTLGAGVDAANIDATDIGIGTILNEDIAVLTVADVAQLEDDGAMTFSVQLSHAVEDGFAVDYQTADGTATAGDRDYDFTTGTLSFVGAAGETRTFAVDITPDGKVEFDEVFTVLLTNVRPLDADLDPADIDVTDKATGTIIRDDGEDLTHLVSIHEVQVIYDHQTGQKIVDVILINRHHKPLYRPLQLIAEVDDINRSFVSLANALRRTFDGKPYVNLNDLAGDSQLDPGERVRARLVFTNGARAFFDYALSFRAMPTDQASPEDTEPPQAGVDLLRTYDPSPALTGLVGDPQAIVEVLVEGRWHEALNRGDGTWRTLDAIHPALTPGQYDVLVRATDPAGNSSQETFTNGLTILAPEPPVIEVDDPSVLFAADIEYNHQTGQLIVSVLVESRSGRTINGPIPLVVEEIDSPTATLANSDGLTADGRPYVAIAKSQADGQLIQGHLVRVGLVFNNALGSSFGCKLSTRGALIADATVPVTTPPVMTVQSVPEAPKPVEQGAPVTLSLPAPVVTTPTRVTTSNDSSPDVEPEPLDDLVEINVLQQQYDHQGGDVTVGVLLTNRSGQMLQGPLQLTVKRLSSPIISPAQPSGRTSQGLDYLDLTGYLDSLRFRSGQSIYASVTFNNAARTHFQFEFGIRGFLDSDDNWSVYSRL